MGVNMKLLTKSSNGKWWVLIGLPFLMLNLANAGQKTGCRVDQPRTLAYFTNYEKGITHSLPPCLYSCKGVRVGLAALQISCCSTLQPELGSTSHMQHIKRYS